MNVVVSGIIRQHSLRLWRIIVKYNELLEFKTTVCEFENDSMAPLKRRST